MASDREVRFEAALSLAGFLLMATVVVVAATTGLFGKGGPTETAFSGDGAWSVTYDRRVRWYDDTWVQFSIPPKGLLSQARVAVDRAYFDAMRIDKIVPEPASVSATNDRLLFTFNSGDRTRPVVARFYLQPERIGLIPLTAALEDGTTVQIRQRVLP